MPVYGQNNSLAGVIYVDNAFTNEPIAKERYEDLATLLGKHLSRISRKAP
jgi:hypothetical protein